MAYTIETFQEALRLRQENLIINAVFLHDLVQLFSTTHKGLLSPKHMKLSTEQLLKCQIIQSQHLIFIVGVTAERLR